MQLFHPPFSGVPFGLALLIVFLEVINLRVKSPKINSAIDINLIALAIFVIISFITGYQAADDVNVTFSVHPEIIEQHFSMARIALILSLLTVGLRFIAKVATINPKWWQLCYYILLISLFGCIIRTGIMGGELVFKHGAGVYAPLMTK